MNLGKVCIVRIKTLKTSVLNLFDNQMKMIVGVECRKD